MEKTQPEDQKTNTIIDPALDLKAAMDELKIDHTAPGFNEAIMIQQFKEKSENTTLSRR